MLYHSTFKVSRREQDKVFLSLGERDNFVVDDFWVASTEHHGGRGPSAPQPVALSFWQAKLRRGWRRLHARLGSLMDLSHLLCGFGPLKPEDIRRKREALLFGFERWKEIKPKATLEKFAGLVPPALLGQRFGSPAYDHYITAFLSCAAQVGDGFDSIAAAAVLNRIVLAA